MLRYIDPWSEINSWILHKRSLILRGPGGERIVDVVAGETELETQVKATATLELEPTQHNSLDRFQIRK